MRSGSITIGFIVKHITALIAISSASRVHISGEDGTRGYSNKGNPRRHGSPRSPLQHTLDTAAHYRTPGSGSLLQVAAPTFRNVCPSTSSDSLHDLYEPCIEYIKVDWLTKSLSVANEHFSKKWAKYVDKAIGESVQYFFDREDIKDWRSLMDVDFLEDGSVPTRKDTRAIGNLRIVSITLNGEDLLVIHSIVTSLKSAAQAFPHTFGNNTLGEGGFGRVYLARHKATKELVAIKSVHKEKLEDFNFVEIEVARQGFGYNIGLNDVFYSTRKDSIERLELVYPYIDGGDLMSFINIAPRQIEIGVYRRILAQLAWGLLTLHRNGIVHRDVKPENVMIRRTTNEVILIDHGLCMTKCSASEDCSRLATGTMEYVSPDVYQMRGYSYEADWYSFGVLAYVLATKSFPYGSMADQHTLVRRAAKGELDLDFQITKKKLGVPKAEADETLADVRELIQALITLGGRRALTKARKDGGVEKLSGIIENLNFWGPPDGYFGSRTRLEVYMDAEFPGHKGLGEHAESAAACHEQKLK